MNDRERIDAWRRARGVPAGFTDRVLDSLDADSTGRTVAIGPPGATWGSLWQHRWVRVAAAVVAVGVGVIRVGLVLSVFMAR